MGYRQLKISDLSGEELQDSESVTVVVKSAGKVFDCSVEELKALKPLSNVVEVEARYPSGQVSTLLVNKTEFAKVVTDDMLASFDSSRGRRSGFSPVRNGSSV